MLTSIQRRRREARRSRSIFGQTEGRLGDDILDLRELQKTGRIGRIEVNISSKTGKSDGYVLISSSLDKIQTSILAASLETMDRVGPCVASIFVTKPRTSERRCCRCIRYDCCYGCNQCHLREAWQEYHCYSCQD